MSRLRPAVPEMIDSSLQKGRLAASVVPGLLWPTIGELDRPYDLPHFPERYQVERRYKMGIHQNHDTPGLYRPLVAFTSAVKKSMVCILVLDPHFDEVGVDVLASAIESSSAEDIRLLTGGRKCERTKWREKLQSFRNHDRPSSSQAQVSLGALPDKNSFPYLHDRFAVVDSTLWHFGSTVGGGHRGLTAASGPWSEDDTQGRRFFDECWRILYA